MREAEIIPNSFFDSNKEKTLIQYRTKSVFCGTRIITRIIWINSAVNIKNVLTNN